MKKLSKLLTHIDNNILHFLLIIFVLAIPLYPKLPLIFVEYTYIYIRAEDFFVALLNVVFVIQVLRGKSKLNTLFLKFFAAYWFVVILSFLSGTFITHTLPYRQVALLHAMRRFEYMSIFFITASTIKTWKQFVTILVSFAISLILVNIYGFGQRFFGFPAVSTMNPAFATGKILILTPEARISSTFAGHYDLAAFLVFANAIMWGLYFSFKKSRFVLGINFILTYLILMFTASRSSLIGYLSTPMLLLYLRKFKYFFIVIALSGLIFSFNTDLTKRISQTFQIKQILVNEKTGQVYVPQHITSQNLPAGSAYIPIQQNKNAPTSTKSQTQKIIQDATASGKLLTATETASLLADSKNVQSVSSVVADTSFSARLQIEWPRAINAFKKNLLLGTGASSITESSDGDYFRTIGEFGLLGLITFGLIFISIGSYIFKAVSKVPMEQKPIFISVLFAVLALMINATLIDVFEASKVAFILWFILGTFVGYISSQYSIRTHLIHDDKTKAK